MIELLVVVGILTLALGSGSLLLLPWQTLVWVAGWLIGLGALVGVPTGVLYHVRLYQALHPLGLLPLRWYWNPVEFHDLLLDGPERERVLRWFWVAATGFLIVALGTVALAGAVLKVFVVPGQ